MPLFGEPSADSYVRSEADPVVQAEHIMTRLWERTEDTPETRLDQQDALILLRHGGEAGKQMVEAEIEHGRFTPSLQEVKEGLGGTQQH